MTQQNLILIPGLSPNNENNEGKQTNSDAVIGKPEE
jgi:hypothetical protein